MALTATEQTNLMNLVVSMFNAAPGKLYFDQISDYYEANGRSLSKTAVGLSGTGAFNTLYPSYLTAQQFATTWLSTLGLQNVQEANDWVVARANSGANWGQIIQEGTQLLLNSTSGTYAQAKELLLNKAEVAVYYTITKGQSATDLATLHDVLLGVTSADASVITVKAAIDLAIEIGTGKSFNLVGGVDTITGTTGADFFYATRTTLDAFDSVDGGAGTDTFTVVVPSAGSSYTLPTNVVVSNVERLNLQFDPDSSQDLYADVSNWTGLTTMTVVNTGSDYSNYNGITTNGNVTNLSVQGGGSTYIIDNAATDALATVSVDGTYGYAYVYSDALTTLNLSNFDGDGGYGVYVGAAAGTRTLTVNLNNVTDSAYIEDNTATTVSLNVVGTVASDLDIYADVATTLNIAGSQKLTVSTLDTAVLTSINAGTNTGGITIEPLLGTGVAFTGGSGADKITIGGTTKAITMGAGNDTVVFTSATLGVGGTVNGGDGDADVIDMSSASAVTASASGTFNAAVSNFERLSLDVTAAASVINLANLNGATYVTSAGTTAALTLNNLASGGTFGLTGGNVGGVTLNVTGAAAGTADSVNLMLTSAGAAIDAGVITAAGVETVAITTNDTSTTPTGAFNHLLTLVDTAATTITVAGDAGLVLGFAGTAVTTVDASGITKGGFGYTTDALAGAATIKGSATGTNTIDWSLATKAVTYTGGSGMDVIITNDANNTISTGAGADSITLGEGNNTVDAGAGADTIDLGLGLNTVTGGAGADFFEVYVNTNGNTYTTITDAGTGDVLSMFSFGASTFTTARVVLADTAVFQDYLDAATASTTASTDSVVRWFQFGGNTYVVEDLSAGATFQNGSDVVVRLTGLLDLSTATWSAATADLTLA